MEKPKIEVLHMDMPTEKLVVNGGVVEVDEAYEEMIDALIECHEYIDIECKFQDDDNMRQVVCKLKKDIEQALKKAGVKI